MARQFRATLRTALTLDSAVTLSILAIPSTDNTIGGTAASESCTAAPAPTDRETEARRSISARE